MNKNLTRHRQVLSLFQELEQRRMIAFKECKAKMESLTPQERVVATGIWLELSNEEISALLGLKTESKSLSTVRGHVSAILKKFGKSSRVGIALIFEKCLHRNHGKISPWKSSFLP
jgi:DNA-binding NarL/FixJ family response regulator